MLRLTDLAGLGLAAAVLAVVLAWLGSVILTDNEPRVGGAWSIARENKLRTDFPGGRWQGNAWVRCEPDRGSSYGRQARYLEDGRVVQTGVLCWDIVREEGK